MHLQDDTYFFCAPVRNGTGKLANKAL